MANKTAADPSATEAQIADLAYQIHAKAHASIIGTELKPLSFSDSQFLARKELGVAQPKITGPDKETPEQTETRVAGLVQAIKTHVQQVADAAAAAQAPAAAPAETTAQEAADALGEQA